MGQQSEKGLAFDNSYSRLGSLPMHYQPHIISYPQSGDEGW